MTNFRRIHKSKIIRTIDTLSKNERKYLKKKIAFNNNSEYHATDWINISTPKIEVGDIITDYSFSDKIIIILF